MPSRKLTAHCPNCRCKNHLRAAFCNQCGTRLRENQALRDEEGRAKLYADIAHPINSACRELIQQRVIVAFDEEKDRAKLPGYISRYDDFDHEDDFEEARPGGVEPTQVQQAEKPRGPHRTPSHRPQQSSEPTRNQGFGAGVFE
jgi:stage V sporulation protein G